MEKTGSMFAIFLTVFLCLSISVVHADLECQISNVQLNGQGAFLEIEPGGTIDLSFDYKVWEPTTTVPISAQQIIMGLEREPLYCVYHGLPGVFPDVTKGQCQFTMTAPTEPGTYVIRWMSTIQPTPGDARAEYQNSLSLGYGMAEIKVTESGNCGEAGIGINRCEVTGILNGQQDYLEIGPGETIKITIYYEIWNSNACPEVIRQIAIGLDDNPLYCAYSGCPGIYPGINDHDDVFYELTAPTEPGTYHINYISTTGYSCVSAKSLYRAFPSLRKHVGTIKVTGDGNEEWKLIHEKFVDLDYNPYDSIISFYQQGNDLQIQINAIGYNHEISSGSVSISVNESIHVFYHLANVSGLYHPDTNYEKIEPKMTPNERTGFFLISLFGGKIGTAIGVVKYAQDTIDPNKPDWYYEEYNLTENLMVYPKMYFEWTEIPNWRDTVLIPWYTGLRTVRSVKINCPKMDFPKAGIYNMVFRIDYKSGKKIRYDVALPITVT